MKKVFSFLRSMKFGMIMLVLILVLCFAGSMIVQGRESTEYIARYGETGSKLICALGLDHVFTSPAFLIAAALFGINLIDCSVSRFRATLKMSGTFESRSAEAALAHPLTADDGKRLAAFLEKRNYHRKEVGNSCLYMRGRIGFWGSFAMHLSILLVLAVGTLVIVFAKVQDLTVMPGESAFLDDGTEIHVDSFRMTDESGTLDYMSEISVILPDGESSGSHEVRVNEPLRFGNYKFYQQSYGTIGSGVIINEENGEENSIALDGECFLTLDGATGIYYQGLYPGFKYDEDGQLLINTGSSEDYSNPVYLIARVTEEGMETVPLFVGDEASAGGMTLKVNEAVTAPGLRIKQMPGVMLGLLYVVFTLMVASLWLTFFCSPVCIRIADGGFAISSPKPQTGLLLELETEGFIAGLSGEENTADSSK